MKEGGRKRSSREAATEEGLTLMVPALKTYTEAEKRRNAGWFLEAGMNEEQILCECIRKSRQSFKYLSFSSGDPFQTSHL